MSCVHRGKVLSADFADGRRGEAKKGQLTGGTSDFANPPSLKLRRTGATTDRPALLGGTHFAFALRFIRAIEAQIFSAEKLTVMFSEEVVLNQAIGDEKNVKKDRKRRFFDPEFEIKWKISIGAKRLRWINALDF